MLFLNNNNKKKRYNKIEWIRSTRKNQELDERTRKRIAKTISRWIKVQETRKREEKTRATRTLPWFITADAHVLIQW